MAWYPYFHSFALWWQCILWFIAVCFTETVDWRSSSRLYTLTSPVGGSQDPLLKWIILTEGQQQRIISFTSKDLRLILVQQSSEEDTSTSLLPAGSYDNQNNNRQTIILRSFDLEFSLGWMKFGFDWRWSAPYSYREKNLLLMRLRVLAMVRVLFVLWDGAVAVRQCGEHALNVCTYIDTVRKTSWRLKYLEFIG